MTKKEMEAVWQSTEMGLLMKFIDREKQKNRWHKKWKAPRPYIYRKGRK